jgi:MFS family permease
VKLLLPLRERDFALLWIGMTVSLLGDGIFVVAEAWQVYDIDNDPVALSLVRLAWTGGMTAFLLTGGIVSDRVERRRVLIWADIVRALVLALTGALSLAGVLEIWHLVVLAVLYGAGEAFFGPAFGALVPEIVSPQQLVQANSLDQLVRQAAQRLLGPAIGGFVVAAIGAGGAFLVDAGTFAVSAACIWALRVRSVPVLTGGRSARREMREGMTFVRSSHGCGRRSSPPRSACSSSSGRSKCCCPTWCATTSAPAPGATARSSPPPARAPCSARCSSASAARRGAT